MIQRFDPAKNPPQQFRWTMLTDHLIVFVFTLCVFVGAVLLMEEKHVSIPPSHQIGEIYTRYLRNMNWGVASSSNPRLDQCSLQPPSPLTCNITEAPITIKGVDYASVYFAAVRKLTENHGNKKVELVMSFLESQLRKELDSCRNKS